MAVCKGQTCPLWNSGGLECARSRARYHYVQGAPISWPESWIRNHVNLHRLGLLTTILSPNNIATTLHIAVVYRVSLLREHTCTTNVLTVQDLISYILITTEFEKKIVFFQPKHAWIAIHRFQSACHSTASEEWNSDIWPDNCCVSFQRKGCLCRYMDPLINIKRPHRLLIFLELHMIILEFLSLLVIFHALPLISKC